MSSGFLSSRRAVLCVVLVALGCAWPAPRSTAQTVPLTEPQAKAAFVLNFARFVEWPVASFPTRESPVIACVLGRDGVAAALQGLDGRPVQGRVLRARRVASADELRECHVVFLGETDERRLVPLLRGLAGHPVLTVGDAERFIDIGGAIGLVAGEERLQFEINRHAIDQAQLKASANLMRLARNAP